MLTVCASGDRNRRFWNQECSSPVSEPLAKVANHQSSIKTHATCNHMPSNLSSLTVLCLGRSDKTLPSSNAFTHRLTARIDGRESQEPLKARCKAIVAQITGSDPAPAPALATPPSPPTIAGVHEWQTSPNLIASDAPGEKASEVRHPEYSRRSGSKLTPRLIEIEVHTHRRPARWPPRLHARQEHHLPRSSRRAAERNRGERGERGWTDKYHHQLAHTTLPQKRDVGHTPDYHRGPDAVEQARLA